MAGFEREVLLSRNVNFNPLGPKPHTGIITLAGQLLIGTGNDGSVANSPAIAAGMITSPNATINVGYSGGNITLDTGPQAALTINTDSGSASPVANVLQITGNGTTTVSASGNHIIISSAGGGGSSVSLVPQTGTSPVMPSAGLITLSGAVVAAGTNPVRTDGTNANTLVVEVQKSQALVASDATKIGLCNFYSSQFTVDANGFVQLAGGVSPPTLSIGVDTNTAPGTNPVNPNGLGAINLTGGQVASGTVGANVIRTKSSAASQATIEIQRSTAVAAADSTKNGVSHFDSADFTVDTNGFVSLSSSVPTQDLHVARFIVHPSGASVGANYTSIAAAIAAASSGDTIHIQSKATAYTEDLTLKAGVNLVAYAADAYTPNVIIKGKITMTAAGTASISGIQLLTNADYSISITGSNAVNLYLIDCFINTNDHNSIFVNNANAALFVYRCTGEIGALGIAPFTITNCTKVLFEYCNLDNHADSTTQSTIASGQLYYFFCRTNNPLLLTGDAGCVIRYSRIECTPTNVTCLTLNTSDTGSNSFHSIYSSGSATAIVITAGKLALSSTDIFSSATNAISGAGEIVIGGIVFRGSSSTVSVTTQTFYSEGPRFQLGGTGTCQLICGSGSPSGVVTAPKGSLYLRSDGSSTSTRAYINTNSGTTWTNITTAA